MATTFNYFLHTMPGIEPISWLEVRKRYPKATLGDYLFIKGEEGIATFSYPDLLPDVKELHTVSAVFMQLAELPKLTRARQDLKIIGNVLQKSEEVGQAASGLMRQLQLSGPPSYHITMLKVGKYGYKLGNMRQVIERSLAARLPRWDLVPANGHVEVLAELIGNHMLLGFRMTQPSDHVPHNKRKQNDTALPTTTAAAMIVLTEPEETDWFLDPMCGSGTLLQARRFAGPYERLLGGDIENRQVNTAQQNVMHRRGDSDAGTIDIRRWDARSLPIEEDAIDKAALYLPDDKDDGRLYTAVLKELERVVTENGRVVVFSHDYETVKTALRACPHLTLQTGYSAKVNDRWGRIYIINRDA